MLQDIGKFRNSELLDAIGDRDLVYSNLMKPCGERSVKGLMQMDGMPMNLHDKAFYLAIFFMIGVAFASLGMNVWFAALLVAAFAAICRFKKRTTLAFLSLGILAGFFYFHFHQAGRREEIIFDRNTVFQGVVVGYPESRPKSQKLDIELQPPYAGHVSVYAQIYPEFNYGDLMELEGTIKRSPSGNSNISTFPKITLLESGQGSRFRQYLFAVKDKLIGNLKAVLPPQKSGLISGILFGERSEFSDSFKEAMNKSGTTHIVALSGYNISIIAMLISGSLSYVMSRRRSFYISVIFIIAFVLMTGAEASVVRAAIMGIILLLAEQSSRVYSFKNAITLTAVAMLLFDPRLLVFDVGFQFSFAALLGIVYLNPIFKKYLPMKSDPGFLNWRDNFRQTLSAQIAVLPIALITFGYLSPFSLVANVLILSFVPVTMLFGFITSILGLISFSLSLVSGLLVSALLGYEIFIINFFSFNWF